MEACGPHEPLRTPREALLELVGHGPLPHPGHGRTAERLDGLTAAARRSLCLGRLYEAHTDAEAILAEAGHPVPSGLLGVWASDRGSDAVLVPDGARARLSGVKPFCSGATLLDRALVSAHLDGEVQLCLVDLSQRGVTADPPNWAGVGMRSTDTRTVRFDDVPCELVGHTGWYLRRAGFWHGAVGVAASWFGGAVGVLDTLVDQVDDEDPHHLSLLGEAEAGGYAMQAVLWRGASEIDREPDDAAAARSRALRIRRVVAEGCLRVVAVAGEVLGPRGLAFDQDHLQRVADLDVYVRQEHGRHDSEQIGRSALGTDAGC